MTLAAARVALRKLRAELRKDSAAAAAAAAAGGGGLVVVVLASATNSALHLGELLLPVRVSQFFFFWSFALCRQNPAVGCFEELIANRPDLDHGCPSVRSCFGCFDHGNPISIDSPRWLFCVFKAVWPPSAPKP